MTSDAPARPVATETTAPANTTAGHFAMLAFAVLVAGSFSLGGMAAPHIDPAALNAVRFAIGAGLMAAVVSANGRWRAADFRAPWRYVIMGGLMGTFFVLMFVGLRLTDPVSISAVFTLTPLMSAGFGWLLLRQASPPLVLTSLVIAGAGAIWVIFRGDIDAILAFDVGPGEAVFFFGCAAHALYTPVIRKFNRGEPVVVFTFGMMVCGAVLVGGYGSAAIIETDWSALPTVVWIALAYLTVFTTVGTFMLVQFAALRLPAGKVMAYTYLIPGLVILWEGALGHGWVQPIVLPGIAATVVALAMLAVQRDR